MHTRKLQRVRAVLLWPAVCLALPAFAWVVYVALRVAALGERDDSRPVDAVVVLGTQGYSEWPSLAFKTRLDHGLHLYEEGLAPLLIVAGGYPEGSTFTEAATGLRYLKHQGLSSDALLTVGGNNTYQNMRDLKALVEQRGLESVLLVSERFHMFRALVMANDLGIKAYGSPTSTSSRDHNPALRFYNTLREVAAYTAYMLGFRKPTPF